MPQKRFRVFNFDRINSRFSGIDWDNEDVVPMLTLFAFLDTSTFVFTHSVKDKQLGGIALARLDFDTRTFKVLGQLELEEAILENPNSKWYVF